MTLHTLYQIITSLEGYEEHRDVTASRPDELRTFSTTDRIVL